MEIRSVRDPLGFEDSMNTSALMFRIENLQPETLYEIVVSASGPGGNQTAQDRLVFSTKSAGSCVTHAFVMKLKAQYMYMFLLQIQQILPCWLQVKMVFIVLQ